MLVRLRGLAWALGLGMVSSAAFGADAKLDIFKDALYKRLRFIFKDEKLDKTHIGVEVYSLTAQESLFQLNNNMPLSPASTIKLLTALTSLKRLGADFTYKTEVYADGPIRNGTLEGNLYLVGSGDPSLVTERLYLLVDDILRNDIRKINGSIIVDDWTFDQVSIDPNRIANDNDRAYNAPIGGMSFNYNTTTVYFRPADAVGKKPRIYVEPDTGYITIQNKGNTTARGTKYSLVASRTKGENGDTIVVRGNVPLGMGEQLRHFSITQPAIYAGSALRYMLEQRGVTIAKHEVKKQKAPTNATKIATLDSLPLREIVTLMNKFSNNFIADTLVKTLGREIKGAPGTTEKGLEILVDEATKMNINSAGFNVVSGSGLTRNNKITASQFIKLLNSAYLEFDVLPELLSSLPIAGKDGTLKSRMKGTAAYGRLRGKTGTIDGVSALVGVVQSRGGELIAFSVLMNDASKAASGMRPWQNYFAQALAEFNRKSAMPEVPSPLPDVLDAPVSAPTGAPPSGPTNDGGESKDAAQLDGR